MVRLILNGRCIDDEQADPLPHDFCLPGGRVVLSPGVLPLLREVVGVPGLTAEEVQVALAERELEEARFEGVLRGYNRFAPAKGVFDTWVYVLMLPGGKPTRQGNGDTRLAAAQAAVDRVRELRAEAEAKKMPEPTSMTQHEREDELHALGWEHCWGGPADAHHMRPMWIDKSGDATCEGVYPRDRETWEDVTCRALRRARELAGTGAQ